MKRKRKMKQLITIIILTLITPTIKSQNLITNPSFEEVNEITTRWSGTFSVFNRRIKSWDSPTQGSPDILYVKSLDIMQPKRPKVDFKNFSPRTGEFMLGMKTYGCQSNTLHCKEYIQIKLKEPLQSDEKYYFEYWVNPIETSVKVNSFGIAVSMERIKDISVSGLIDMYPISMSEELIESDSNKWQRISGVFEADDKYEYIIIGNFSPDKSIEFKKEKDGLTYGYYLLDDVALRPLNPKVSQELSTNEIIVLEHVMFEFDKAKIQAVSKPQLDELAKYLRSNENYQLEIMGHTDSKGSAAHNSKLSQERADSIKQYLVEKGIDELRIAPIGLGSKYPIVDNETEENRKINRRVEIKVITK